MKGEKESKQKKVHTCGWHLATHQQFLESTWNGEPKMNMDLDFDINSADLQFFDGFGLDLDFIISD